MAALAAAARRAPARAAGAARAARGARARAAAARKMAAGNYFAALTAAGGGDGARSRSLSPASCGEGGGGGEGKCAGGSPTEGAAQEVSPRDDGEIDQSGDLLGQPLVWIDLEMTGLDVEKHTILEIACVVTDGKLRQRLEGPDLVIHHPEEVLSGMNEWCVEHHGASGLTEEVRNSRVSMEEAEDAVLAFVREHIPEPKVGLLAGNSVHADLYFLRRYMPRLADHLHYRIVDVTSIMEVTRRFLPSVERRKPRKAAGHRALADIMESIDELEYYQKQVFERAKQKGPPGSNRVYKTRRG